MRICKGLLASKIVEVGKLGVPFFILQSTDNILVNASNVDPLLSGRASNHLWSHELKLTSERNCLGHRGVQMIDETLGRPYGAFVSWVKGGHEVRIEAKRVVTDLCDLLATRTWGVEHSEDAGAVGSTEHLRAPYEGATGGGTGSLVPSQSFIDQVNKKKDGEEGLEDEKKDDEEEPSVSVLEVLDDGALTPAEMQARIEREAREEEEREALAKIEAQNAEVKKRLEGETAMLFDDEGKEIAEVTRAEKEKEKLAQVQQKIEAELKEVLESAKMDASEPLKPSDGLGDGTVGKVLSGDELLSHLQTQLDSVSRVRLSKVNVAAFEADAESKKIVKDELESVKKRVEQAEFVPAQASGVNGQELVDEILGGDYLGRGRGVPFPNPANKPVVPAMIDETDQVVSEKVKKTMEEVRSEKRGLARRAKRRCCMNNPSFASRFAHR